MGEYCYRRDECRTIGYSSATAAALLVYINYLPITSCNRWI